VAKFTFQFPIEILTRDTRITEHESTTEWTRSFGQLQSEILALSGCNSVQIGSYRRFGKTYRFHPQRSSLTLDDGTDRNVDNYQHTLRNIAEGRESHLHSGGSLKSRSYNQQNRTKQLRSETRAKPQSTSLGSFSHPCRRIALLACDTDTLWLKPGVRLR
jgi:hypothetical protein